MTVQDKTLQSTTVQDQKIDLDAGRRAFVRSLGFGAAGAALLGGIPGYVTPAEAAVTDVDILNFALNLEYLEAEFYLHAVTGQGLPPAQTTGKGGPPGQVIGGSQVPFTSRDVHSYAREIASDEAAHVKFLRQALGGARVGRPTIDLRNSFTAAARAAGLVGPNQQFNAFANETNFLLAAFIFEDVGVTAYKGAAPLLTNKTYLAAAAGILAVEAYHAGEIRTLLYARNLFQEAAKISDLRDSVDGNTDLDQGIGDADTANIVPADANGIAFSRNTDQVLSIVYLSPTANKGGFFPQGVRGNID